ncbi:MAG: hypothetical protein MUO26_14525 [Methanotrichaceae archaeon]|nr:hypothetical protein [Methanotrichaceae archaeon]
MKTNLFLVVLSILLLTSAFAMTEEVNVDLLKQNMMQSADNLTTYAYKRTAESKVVYSNESLKKDFRAVKTTNGKLDLISQAGSWNAQLKDNSNVEVLSWDGYFLNGSEYWKEGKEWTKFAVNDSEEVLEDYNELPGQVALIDYSNMQIVGTDIIDGQEYYKLVGSPKEPVFNGFIGMQLIAAYFPSPFPMPDELKGGNLDINSTDLINNSNIILTAWVSEKDSLLKRLDINSNLSITPEILNITSENFRIQTYINESTTYKDFGSPMKISLPKEAPKNMSSRLEGTDWRWAVFGSLRP